MAKDAQKCRRNQPKGVMLRGTLSIARLGEEYVVKLDKLAHKWECETLSEAALELLKDAIDQELEK